MRVHLILCVAVAALMPSIAGAQHARSGASRAIKAPHEASQFDFLVGQWEIAVTPKVSGLAARIHGVPKLRGTWKGWHALDGWGIEDEMRIVDESGNPQALTHYLRVYDPAAKRWAIAAVDAYRQQIVQSSAQWQRDQMIATSIGTDGEGRTYTTRSRMSAISPTSFRLQQDRSYDGGKSWDEARLVIEAKRVAVSATR
jgi:hypothetical protein